MVHSQSSLRIQRCLSLLDGRGKGSQVWLVAGALAVATIVLRWPGTLIGDNLRQLQEIQTGRITDWHPPLMTVIWRALGATPQSMLLLQVPLYWAGIALIADALRRETSLKWALAVLLTGLTPMSLLYLGTIQKDTLLVALLLVTAGFSLRFGRSWALASGLLAALTRVNAIFAVPPLFVTRQRLLPTVLVCAALSAALLPVSQFINHKVLGAERSHVEKALQLFDIAGIEHHSGKTFLNPDFSRCYSVFYWDSLELDCQAFARTPDSLATTWMKAIREEPLAYAAHRLDHFNHTIFFLVPPLQECVYVPKHHPNCGPGGDGLLKDAVLRNAFLWPVTWLAIGVSLLFMRLELPVRMFALSGLLYGGGYLLVGVAAGFRYFYWTELAVQLAIVWQLATIGIPHWRRIAALVASIWLIGYAYRYLPLLA